MIELHLSYTNHWMGIDFFNSDLEDRLRGEMIRFEEIESQWINIFEFIDSLDNKTIKIYLRGFEDPIFCLSYLLREGKINNSPEDFVIIDGDKRARFVKDDLGYDLEGDVAFSSLRGKWLF